MEVEEYNEVEPYTHNMEVEQDNEVEPYTTNMEVEQDNEVEPYTLPSDNFRFVTDEKEASQLADWYKKAISRTSKYVNPNLAEHILGGAAVWSTPNAKSALIGEIYEGIFVVSHYAPDPSNPFAGAMLLKKAAKSLDQIIMSVPEPQSKMLEQAGFVHIAEIDQYFGEELVHKNVMVNNAVLENIESLSILAERMEIDTTNIMDCEVCGRKTSLSPCSQCRKTYLSKKPSTQRLDLTKAIARIMLRIPTNIKFS
jgi:CYTH domain-containing protein